MFASWDDPAFEHIILDTETGQLLDAVKAFDFERFADQKNVTRWERFAWIFQLYWYLKKYRYAYDLVHYHELWWGSLLSGLWAKRRSVPTIYESVLLGSDTPSAIRSERLGRVKVWLLKQFTGILAISDQIGEDYLEQGFLPEQVCINVNCLDTDLFHPLDQPQLKTRLRAQFNLPVDAFVLLFVGSLIHRKGVDLLIEAFIQAQRRNSRLHLWLVGPQNKHENPSLDEVFVNQLKQELSVAGLGDAVTFSGMIADRDALAEVYLAADVFVFPSRKEGLPNVVLEAMACGLPAIVSDLPGLKNVIIPGKNGVVVPIGDHKRLQLTIESLVDGTIDTKMLGQNARDYVQVHHTFSAWQKRMIEIYTDLSDKSRIEK